MNKLSLILALLFSSSASAGIFSADVRDLDEPCLVYDSDGYFGVTLGRSKPQAQNHSATAKYFGSGGAMVGHRFNSRWAIEGSYLFLGSFYNSNLNQTTSLDTFAVELVRRFALDDKRYVSLYVKGGYAATWITLQPLGSAWHGDLTYGAGIELTASDAAERSWYLRLGANKYNTGSFTPIYQGTYAPKDSVINLAATLIINY